MERKVYNAPRAEVITFDEELLGGTSGGGAQKDPGITQLPESADGAKSHGFDLWID